MDDMPEYLTLVRGGRPPSPELVSEMRHNYEAIGGRSPLSELTMAQGAALQARLGPSIPVAVGMRNWRPFLAEAVAQLVQSGVRRIIAIPLAPQFSTLSVAKYYAAAETAMPTGVELVRVASCHQHPQLLEAFAERVREMPPTGNEELVFTAHSLPVRVAAAGDRYAHEVARTARGIAERLGLPRYRRAFQSAGRTADRWMGLDLSELLRHRVARGGRRFLVVPIGFVCDHTEILFDIDIQAAGVARELGVQLQRTASLNDSPVFVRLLESLVLDRL